MEIGGYIELDHYTLPMLHEDGIKLNCGRNALAYLIETKGIRTIAMPKYMCDSNDDVLQRYHVKARYYSIDQSFRPVLQDLKEDEWLYVVNFYGQLPDEYLLWLHDKHRNLIVDHAQAYFQEPIPGIDTLYTCRKFFGVADGALLFTDRRLERRLERDESYERMHFLLGRYERAASEFYDEYVANNRLFAAEPIKNMSALTENLLHAIDYGRIRKIRTENFAFLHEKLAAFNRLQLTIPDGAFMYPYYVENGAELRQKLQKQKIYIPTLWPAVFKRCGAEELEYKMASNILPIPVDQRYGIENMEYILNEIKQL